MTITPRYKQLSNGATYDYQTHRIVAIDPSKNPHSFTSESASKAVAIREEEKIKAIQEGMMQGAKVDHPGKALQSIIACQTTIATDNTHTRSTEAARLVLQVADVMPDKAATPHMQVNVFPPGLAERILQLTDDIVEGECVPVSELPGDAPPGVPAGEREQADSRQTEDAQDEG